MRTPVLVVLAGLMLAGGVLAQPVDSFLHVGNWIPSGAPLIRFDATGKTQTTLGRLPLNFSVLRFTLAEDNATCRAIGYFDMSPNYRGAVIDVSPKGVVTTFATSAHMIAPNRSCAPATASGCSSADARTSPRSRSSSWPAGR